MGEGQIVTLGAVVLGWRLGQLTSLVRWVYSAVALRRGLLQELEDLDAQLGRILLIHARQLQIYSLGGIEPTAALPAPNMYFRYYFGEAFPFLNREQRLSYQLIHSSVDSLNERNSNLMGCLRTVSPEEDSKEGGKEDRDLLEEWGREVKELYRLAATTRWHIRYHLDNPNCPKLDFYGEVHESYLQNQENIEKTIEEIISKAKNLNRQEFERWYNPRQFEE